MRSHIDGRSYRVGLESEEEWRVRLSPELARYDRGAGSALHLSLFLAKRSSMYDRGLPKHRRVDEEMCRDCDWATVRWHVRDSTSSGCNRRWQSESLWHRRNRSTAVDGTGTLARVLMTRKLFNLDGNTNRKSYMNERDGN